MGDTSTARGKADSRVPISVKIIVAGGVGVGKTALVGSLSEIGALRTVETGTPAELGIADTDGFETKAFPFDALDFGRITIDDALILYLFDTPEQGRRWFYRDEVAFGALGAVILADPNRLDECIPAIDYFKSLGTPYMVAVNGGGGSYQLEQVRRALAVDPAVPVAHCDPRLRDSGKNVLITLIEYVKAIVSGRSTAPVSA